ncbi:MAG: hypothetical protein KTR24_03770 [Saprospiraceae bacterium]|nr:hypothetical protein [Saprospiraceae bacterium]
MSRHLITVFVALLLIPPVKGQSTTDFSFSIESTDFENSKLQLGTNSHRDALDRYLNAAHHIISFRDLVINMDKTNLLSMGNTRAFSIRLQEDSGSIRRGESILIGDVHGNIGIGDFEQERSAVSNPKAKLHIKDGDIYLEDVSSGVIMKSEDGNCWRMTIDNSGQISVNQVICP